MEKTIYQDSVGLYLLEYDLQGNPKKVYCNEEGKIKLYKDVSGLYFIEYDKNGIAAKVFCDENGYRLDKPNEHTTINTVSDSQTELEQVEQDRSYTVLIFLSVCTLLGQMWFGSDEDPTMIIIIGLISYILAIVTMIAFKNNPYYLRETPALKNTVVHFIKYLILLCILPASIALDPEVEFNDPTTTITIFIGSIFVAPVLEELVYRGFLFNKLNKLMSDRVAALVSGLIFAITHFDFSASFTYYVFQGYMYARLYTRTNRLSYSMIAHAIHNYIFTL